MNVVFFNHTPSPTNASGSSRSKSLKAFQLEISFCLRPKFVPGPIHPKRCNLWMERINTNNWFSFSFSTLLNMENVHSSLVFQKTLEITLENFFQTFQPLHFLSGLRWNWTAAAGNWRLFDFDQWLLHFFDQLPPFPLSSSSTLSIIVASVYDTIVMLSISTADQRIHIDVCTSSCWETIWSNYPILNSIKRIPLLVGNRSSLKKSLIHLFLELSTLRRSRWHPPPH